jgi:CDP-glucose 4,6-dehydratase
MKKNKTFWKEKNVLITGAAGFVGSNLSKNLSSQGAKVVGLVQSKRKESLLFYEKIDKKINLVFGDINDRALLKKILIKFKIEVCFHLAAQVEVGLAKQDPFGTWETNVRGTYSLLETIRENKKNIKSVIVASSDKAYGEHGIKKMPYQENYNLQPIFPYDTSKACADMIAKSYTSKLYKLPVIISRFSNIYGPGQLNFTALIPDAIVSCIKNKRLTLRGDGEAIRDFIHVDDIVDVYKLLGEKLYLFPKKYSGEIFNAGTNSPKKIKDVVKTIYHYKKKYTEFKKTIKNIKKNKTSGEISVQFMDFKKLYKYFKWKPKIKFEKTLPSLFKWYGSYLKKNN